MKRKLYFGMILCGVCFVTGCTGANENNTSSQKDTSAVYASVEPTQTSQTVQAYCGDENDEFLISKSVSVDAQHSEDKDLLTQALQQEGVLSDEVECNSMTTQDKEDQTILKVDFNAAFQDAIWDMGTSGERMYVGSVVNTFLTAEKADKIKITVEGETLESGHTIYDQAMTKFDAAEETYLIGHVAEHGKEPEVELQREYCGIGIAYNYAYKNFSMSYDEQERILSILSKKKDKKGNPKAYLTITPCEGSVEDAAQRMMDADDSKEYVSMVSGNIGKDQALSCEIISCDTQAVGMQKSYYFFESQDTTWKMEVASETDSLQNRLQLTLESLEIVK